ncbi:dihydrolipoamide acetyltransferase family protein [Saccharopolyspora sp. NPDC049357]|uniref:dihydrolipoamide acetyltransferase family protein n=1 Tax=Saccharopolyspora sp. NPDC049357 TaxID=3154507 RepID=UPI00344ACC16
MREIPLVMPKMSMTMEEGTLVVWHKAINDQVRVGDVVCEVATDKVDMEVESPTEGTLTRLVADPDQVVAVGDPIAYISSTADDLLEGLLDGPDMDDSGEDAPSAPAPSPVAVAQAPAALKRAVPLARIRARKLGIDLNAVEGTGAGGTVRVVDVERTAAAQAVQGTGHNGSANGAKVQPAPVSSEGASEARPGTNGVSGSKRRSTRAAVARKMTASAAIPQFTIYRDLDLDAVAPHRGRRTWTTVLTRAFACVLRDMPELNAQWVDDTSQPLETVAIALAVDTDRGLLAPVLSDPDATGVEELDHSVRDLVQRARAGKLTVDELSATASSTVSNLGGLGVEAFNALLTPPQATALSLGSVGPRLVPVLGGIETRTSCTVGLTVDHRVADGADAARALEALQTLLRNPWRLGLATPGE